MTVAGMAPHHHDAVGAVLDHRKPPTPGGAPQRGAKEFDAAFERMAAAPKTHEVIHYRLDFEDVKVFGNYAVEWGAIRGATREIATGRIVASEYHVMRVLRRQKNGSWKVYRSIWAPRVAPPAG